MDEVYAYRLMSYMKGRGQQLSYEVFIFTDEEALAAYLSENACETLITASPNRLSEINLSNVHYLIVLTEENDLSSVSNESCDQHFIFKYQSAENIIKEVSSYCNNDVYQAMNHLVSHSGGRIFGVYSPMGYSYKTSFSLALAQMLGKRARVLYINLEEYSGLNGSIFERERATLSEILYMYRRGSLGLRNKVNEYARRVGNFYYLAPVDCPDDVEELLAEEWVTFFRYLAESCDYEYIVVDIGNIVKKSWVLFEIMDTVFMPVRSDGISESKVNDFRTNMLNMGREPLLERIVTVNVPYDRSLASEGVLNIGTLEWSALGEYVRRVIDERDL